MREYWILTKLQGSSLFGINRIRHEKDGAERKKRRRDVLLLAVMAFSLVYISVLYSSLMISALAPMGLADLVLLMMAAASSVIVFLFSLFETKGVLFGFGDYDTVMSWPVRASAVAASRLTAMYVYNLVYALLFLLRVGHAMDQHVDGQFPQLILWLVNGGQWRRHITCQLNIIVAHQRHILRNLQPGLV